ncbi:MAG: hypothetical protein LJE67_04055 [Salaquimonas sp.]|jgi:hypothetical protein|nr:hypothetical protein [Salaquimonas sp.]
MKTLSATIRDWMMRERDRAYVAGLSRIDQEDLGMLRADVFELLDGRDDTRDRLLAMAARFGLSAEDIDRDRQTCLDISLACGKCKSSGICARFLAGDSYVGPDDFCPNASRYAEMAGAA